MRTTQRANHLQRQTSATRPRYLFVTCLQPAGHRLGAVRFNLRCAQGAASSAVPLFGFERLSSAFGPPHPALLPPCCWDGLRVSGTGIRSAELGRSGVRSRGRTEGCLESTHPLCLRARSFHLFTEQETGIVLVPHWGISVFPSALALSSAFPALPVHQVQRFPQEQAGNKEVTEATESTIYSCPLCQEWVVKPCLAAAALAGRQTSR